ncbi:glycosyltransferase [Vogesella sp. LIG4]|uniref:glycosyltransferase n=1 Tax=Vogesella sp. LIG4 TaxID=1192162 RepID=UPI0012FDB09B|nr:glycosyltransferase [Vogesella sp. LIG4]
MNVISIVNIDYQAYEDALKQHLPLRSRIKLKFSKFFQNSGAKHYPSIAVSNFVTSTYKKKGINVLTTISNSIQESNRINHAPTWNGRFIYAGSGSFFGKGIDILIQLAKRGLEIDCYTDAVYDGLKSFPPLPRKILLDRYRDYCMLIFPSRYESFGFVPLEAMSAGLPVLLRRTGIGCDLENEIPEFILSSTDEKIADEIMEKIALIKNDYENFSRRAQEFSKNFCEHANFDSAWLRLLQYHAKGQK